MALLYDSDDTTRQECGGTLVGDRYVITAAHCSMGENNIRVVIGDTTLGVANDTTRLIIRVSEIREHPKFNLKTVENDISVLVLSSPVDLKEFPNIKPACLPTTETKSEMFGRSAVVSGWGKNNISLVPSNLNELTVKILSDCGNLLFTKGKILMKTI